MARKALTDEERATLEELHSRADLTEDEDDDETEEDDDGDDAVLVLARGRKNVAKFLGITGASTDDAEETDDAAEETEEEAPPKKKPAKKAPAVDPKPPSRSRYFGK